MKLSARNSLKGTVTGIEKGSVNATVKIDVGGGTIITSMITNDAVEEHHQEISDCLREKGYEVVAAAPPSTPR